MLSCARLVMVRLALPFALVLFACGGSDASSPQAPPPPVASPPDAAPAPPDAATLIAGPDGILRGPLPAHVDPRVDAILAEPVPDDVILVYASIEEHAVLDYRWDLDRAGRIYFVRRSDSAPDGVAFDQPLPAVPNGKLDAWHLKEVTATLALHHVFDHPGFERGPGNALDYVIVRARQPDGGALHTIVFANSRPELLDFLEAVTVAL